MLNKENSKNIFLLGDFNIYLLEYETFEPVNNFVGILSSNFLSPLILLSTRISSSSSTLIDNIFCNVTFNANMILGNFTSTVSDHLPQFAIIEDDFANSPKSKSNILKRNWKSFDQNLFVFLQILRMPTGMKSLMLTKKKKFFLYTTVYTKLIYC